MQEIERQIKRLAFSEGNREVLRSWEQFFVPSDDDRFSDILKRMDAAENLPAPARRALARRSIAKH